MFGSGPDDGVSGGCLVRWVSGLDGYGLVQVRVGVVAEEPVPIRPKVVLAPAPRVPFQLRFLTVTLLPLVVRVPFQTWLIVCPLGRVQVTVQPLRVEVPPLATVTSVWNPPVQLLTTR